MHNITHLMIVVENNRIFLQDLEVPTCIIYTQILNIYIYILLILYPPCFLLREKDYCRCGML